MGKKKRQEMQYAFLEKELDQEGVKSCHHIAKSINLNRLKPKRNPKLQQKRLGMHNSPAVKDKEPLWICLKCVQLDCGRKQHTDNKPADLHCISFNMDTKSAWCNVCNIHFGPKDNQKVNRALQYLQQHLEDTSEEYENAKVENKIVPEPEMKQEEIESFKRGIGSCVHPPRGLKNLGNTCYFNVVLQCLARTPNFISQMEKLKELSEVTLEKNVSKDGPEKRAEVKLKVGRRMDFSDLLLKTLEELHMSAMKPYAPIKLLNELCRVSSSITKDEQHDAHELLREVFDKIKEIVLQRFKSPVLNFNSPNSSNKEEMDNTIQQRIQSNENCTAKSIFPDEIFGGMLVSILECEECGKTSYINEAFMDLSLPITNKASISFEMNKHTNRKPEKKNDSLQQKKMYTTTVTKDKTLKNEETECSDSCVEDHIEQNAAKSWIEDCAFDLENHEHQSKGTLSNENPDPSRASDEKILSLSSTCSSLMGGESAELMEGAISSAGSGIKNEEHMGCKWNLNCNGVDTKMTTRAERFTSAVEVESKDSEHKECLDNLAVSCPCSNSASSSINVDVSPTTPKHKSDRIMTTAESTEIKYGEHGDPIVCLPMPFSCPKTAGTTLLDNSNTIMNASDVESLDRENEDSMKTLAATSTSVSSLYHESTGSPFSERDTPSPVSSEINIDCSCSIRMQAGCSSPAPSDCNGYRPVSRFAFCDDVDSVARCSPVNETSGMSFKAAVNELNSVSSNHIMSPEKLSTSNEASCNDSELLECSAERSPFSLMTSEHLEVDGNQTEIIESVKKMNLNAEDNLGSCVPQHHTNAEDANIATTNKEVKVHENYDIDEEDGQGTHQQA